MKCFAWMRTLYTIFRISLYTVLQRAKLDLAREDLSIVLTQNDEGRATMAQVEAARANEQEELIRYYDSQRAVELARLNVRRTTGTILADAR